MPPAVDVAVEREVQCAVLKTPSSSALSDGPWRWAARETGLLDGGGGGGVGGRGGGALVGGGGGASLCDEGEEEDEEDWFWK